jgi:hypothetical protein
MRAERRGVVRECAGRERERESVWGNEGSREREFSDSTGFLWQNCVAMGVAKI